jgi:hypothetical protein
VQIDRLPRDAGGLRDLIEADAVIAAILQQLSRGEKDPRSGVDLSA